MAISGLQTRLRLWCLGGEKKCQEQKPLKVALVCQSAFLIHSLFSFLWEVREEVEEVKVGRRLKAGYQRKRPCPCSGQKEQSQGRVLEGSP